MSYRCDVCQEGQPPGKKASRHLERRADGSTVREWRVCPLCFKELEKGNTPRRMAKLCLQRRQEQAEAKERAKSVLRGMPEAKAIKLLKKLKEEM